MVVGNGLIQLLIYVLVVGVICWLCWWLVDYIGLPEPFNKVFKVIIAIFAVLFLANVLLGFVGHPIVMIK